MEQGDLKRQVRKDSGLILNNERNFCLITIINPKIKRKIAKTHSALKFFSSPTLSTILLLS
jgi:hypothetical protein